jgi:predicted MFS family arabinose efflux permease
VPIRYSLAGAVAISLLAPTLASAWVLIPALIAGMPSFGTLFTPAMTLVSEGAQHQQLDQGLAFSLANLAWAVGQAVAAAGSGALAQATSDLVPYSLLAAACLATLALIRLRPSPQS